MHITVEEIQSTPRIGMYPGEAWNIVIRIYRAGDSRIGEMLGGTEYPRLVSCDKRSLLIKFDPESPTALAATHVNAGGPSGNGSTVGQQTNSTKATLGYMKLPW